MEQSNTDGLQNDGINPSFWRGLTEPRISRRQVLTASGVGLGAVLLGSMGSSPLADAASSVGSKSWWKKQKLHHTLNFANWPTYIDTVGGKYPSLEHFTATTGIKVNYDEVINANTAFYQTIRPALSAGQYTGYDLIVMTTNNPPLSYLIDLKWLIPLDRSMMTNFDKYAGPLIKNPSWDPGNKYTMAWQSGWTIQAYNKTLVKNPGDSIDILFDKKYAGRVGMLNDPYELGCVGLLATGVEPDKSTEKDWTKAAKKLQLQKSDGIVAGYYDTSYIQYLKNGDTWVSMCYSGDIFQANLNSKYKDLEILFPIEGAMFYTDNMCIPLYAENPLAAMTLMDFYYTPMAQAVVEYYNDYVCPVPAAKEELLHPTGWAKAALKELAPEIGEPTSVTANASTVFPTTELIKDSRSYYNFTNQDEIDAWNGIFLPIIQGA